MGGKVVRADQSRLLHLDLSRLGDARWLPVRLPFGMLSGEDIPHPVLDITKLGFNGM